MQSKDIDKKTFYESVKTLIESDNPHIHLSQHKLFTLFSIGLQYLFFNSTKNPGTYIIRIEDFGLAQKLAYKAKDRTSRSFLSRLILSRKLKFEKSMFYLDFFNPNTWGITSALPPEKIKGTLVVKNTTSKPFNPMQEADGDLTEEQLQEIEEAKQNQIFTEQKLYYSTLKDICPTSVVIAFEEEYAGTKEITFPFIVKQKEQIKGIKLADDLDPELYN